MPRRRVPPKRPIPPDPRYHNVELSKLVGRMMLRGKKSQGYRTVYRAMDIIKEKSGKDPLEVYLKALENIKPVVEVKSRRVGGSTYQVPVEVRESRREALAMRWLIQYSRGRHGNSMGEKLAGELLDASNSTGAAFKKKEDTHRMAEANKAFAHYRW
jgi:small subunit ribosomal protein S7